MTEKRKILNRLAAEYNDKHYGTKYFTDRTWLISELDFDYMSGYRYFVRYQTTHTIAASFKNMDDAIQYLKEDLEDLEGRHTPQALAE